VEDLTTLMERMTIAETILEEPKIELILRRILYIFIEEYFHIIAKNIDGKGIP